VHAHDILHMDLKPENVFQHGTLLKIGDFGNSVKSAEYDDDDGDPIYLAPEVLKGIAAPQSDVFSLGLMYYEMATRCELPSMGPEWQWLRSGEVTMLWRETWPSHIDQVVLPMLQPDLMKRPPAQLVLDRCKAMELPAGPDGIGMDFSGKAMMQMPVGMDGIAMDL